MSGGFPVTSTMGSPPVTGSNDISTPQESILNRPPAVQHMGSGSGQHNGGGYRPVEQTGNGSGLNGRDSSDGQDSADQPPRKKPCRHTAHQIQELERVFSESPNPDQEQRLKLCQDLGLTPNQVKFWFQNKRTQTKAKTNRNENAALKDERKELESERERIKIASESGMCADCLGSRMEKHSDELHHLRLENARLKDELQKLHDTDSRLAGSSDQTMGLVRSNSSLHFSGDIASLSIMDEEKTKAMQLALAYLNEILKVSLAVEPLWIRGADGREVFNTEEYGRMFPCARQLPQMRTEASRGTSVVNMNPVTLVANFLRADKWMEMFPSIISKASMQIIAGSPVNPEGALLLMHAEMHMLSPLVPTREVIFVRYCHKFGVGTWAIVDFPVDGLPSCNHASRFLKYKRKPSGCIIEDVNCLSSKVTMLEHVEVEDTPVHQIFNQFVCSGRAFGASKWLATLKRQCERLVRLMDHKIPNLGEITTQSREARTNLMNLGKRMMRSFCVSMSTSGGQAWRPLSQCREDTARMIIRISTEPGYPKGLILIAASTSWLPYTQKQVFDILGDADRRAQVMNLSNGNPMDVLARIPYDSDHPGNCISLLLNPATYGSFMLQESYTDGCESVVAYTIMNLDNAQVAMFGPTEHRDPCTIPILPHGFVIVPDQASMSGCLLTVGLQHLASTDPYAQLNPSSFEASVNNHFRIIFQKIKTALSSQHKP